MPGQSGPITQIAAGGADSLALTSTGQLYGSGSNLDGQLGSTGYNGFSNPNPTPALIALPEQSGPVTQIAAGASHSLALTSTGQLFAFGENYYGQLGNSVNNETFDPNPTPAPVTLPGASGSVVRIAAGGAHSLALTSTGQLYAFGNDAYGQLGGEAGKAPHPVPTEVHLWPVGAMAVGPSANHTLAVVSGPPEVTTSSLPGGRVGTPYSATAEAEGGAAPYTWEATGLPAGLSIDPASGRIGGTPRAEGTASVVLRVIDGFNRAAASAPIALSIEGAPAAVAGEAGRPVIRNLRQSHRRWREGSKLASISSRAAGGKGGRIPIGTAFSFRLNGGAKVSLLFERRKGMRFGKAGALSFAGHAGRNLVRFQGRISRHKRLEPGRYRLTVTARSGVLSSQPRSLRFTIVTFVPR